MAEVAQTKGPSKAELSEKFDEIFGADDAEGTAWVEGENATQNQDQVEQAETEPVEATEAEGTQAEGEVEASSEAEQVAEEVTNEVVNEKPPKNKDAQSRIRQLAREKNELKDELQKTQQYFNYQLEQMKAQAVAEQRAWREQQERSIELQRKQFEILQSDREAAEFEKLPIDKKIEARARKEAETAWRRELDERERKWQSRLDQLEQQRMAERQEADRQKRLGGLDYQAEQALDNVVLKGLPAEQAKQLKPQMKEMLMAWCGAYGEYPNEAAPRFAKYIDNMFAAKLQTKRNPNVAKKVGVQAPSATNAPLARTRGVAQKRTTAEAIKARGLRGPLEDLSRELFGD